MERRESFGGTRTRVVEVDGAGPPFLLLHGYSDSADTWRPVLRELSRLGRGAVAVDLPGFGRADRANGGPLLPQVDRFVDALAEAHPGGILVGNSLGGVAGLRAAQRSELPVAGIVGASPAGLGHAPWVTAISRNRYVQTIARAPVPLPRPVMHRLLAQAYRRVACVRPDAVEPEVANAYASHFRNRDDVKRIVQGAFTLLQELDEEDCYDLASIEKPVMLVWGKSDRLVPSSGAQRVLDAVPGTRLELLPRVGHLPQIESPRRFTELIVDFADELA